MGTEIRKEANKLTDAAVAKLKPEGKTRTVYPDSEVPGLELRVAPDGTRSFSLLYRPKGDPKKRRVSLGVYPDVKLGEARELARGYRNEARAGRDPSAERKREIAVQAERRANTVGAVAEDFLRLHVASLRSAREAEGVIRRELLGQFRKSGKDEKGKKVWKWADNPSNPRWRDRPVTEISSRDVKALLRAIIDGGHPYAARHALAWARGMFRWAIDEEAYGLELDPCSGVSAKKRGAPAVPRQVTLGADHLRLIWRAAESLGEPCGPFMQMLILSGQRRNEIARLRWSEIDMAEKVIVLPAERMKAKHPHELPLSAPMLDLLNGLTRKGDWVFPAPWGGPIGAFSRLKPELDKAIAGLAQAEGIDPGTLPAWRLHDLRRTMRTGLGAIPDIASDVRELTIAHIPPALVRTYDLHDYREPKRKALDLWAGRLARIVNPPPADRKVVPIHG
jgi:integrase